MLKFFPLLIILVVIISVLKYYFQDKNKTVYRYTKKRCFMNPAELELFRLLSESFEEKYWIFAQVHLPTILEHKISGQTGYGAFRHINEKSVDFVLCDKQALEPILAIELDGKSHESTKTILRDAEVERIFAEAGLKLLRIQNHGAFDKNEITKLISQTIPHESLAKGQFYIDDPELGRIDPGDDEAVESALLNHEKLTRSKNKV